MGQILHARATTTQRQRAYIQQSKESLAVIANRLGVNPKTVAKWRKRTTVDDAPMGARNPRSSLSDHEQRIVCAFRQKTLLPLDDCFVALKDEIPSLTRSNLHRCLQRHGLSVLPKEEKEKRKTKKFKAYPLGFFNIYICDVRTGEGKVYLYVAVDRTTKFVYAEIHPSPTMAVAARFLHNLAKAVPYRIAKVLTDNGPQFTYALLLPHCKPKGKTHVFDHACQTLHIEHRLTRFRHPWTNGQVERMNRTIKEATIKTYHYATIDQLKSHLHTFLMAYNYAKKLKALRFITPYEKIIAEWKIDPSAFHANPNHFIAGLNI
ncbi:MAG: IS481 family transposase [Rhodomicrobium sp.]|nr:IS481 family transposase [Rhodomicrobium sp.]